MTVESEVSFVVGLEMRRHAYKLSTEGSSSALLATCARWHVSSPRFADKMAGAQTHRYGLQGAQKVVWLALSGRRLP